MRGQIRSAAATTGIAVELPAAAGCGGGDEGAGSTATARVDDGAAPTRVTTEPLSRAYAEAYHATQKNEAEVTAYPNAEYPAKHKWGRC